MTTANITVSSGNWATKSEAQSRGFVLLDDAVAELASLVSPSNCPEKIGRQFGMLSNNQIKLFCLVGEAVPAIEMQPAPGLYASDFLLELVAAARTLDWEKIGALIEQADIK